MVWKKFLIYEPVLSYFKTEWKIMLKQCYPQTLAILQTLTNPCKSMTTPLQIWIRTWFLKRFLYLLYTAGLRSAYSIRQNHSNHYKHPFLSVYCWIWGMYGYFMAVIARGSEAYSESLCTLILKQTHYFSTHMMLNTGDTRVGSVK